MWWLQVPVPYICFREGLCGGCRCQCLTSLFFWRIVWWLQVPVPYISVFFLKDCVVVAGASALHLCFFEGLCGGCRCQCLTSLFFWRIVWWLQVPVPYISVFFWRIVWWLQVPVPCISVFVKDCVVFAGASALHLFLWRIVWWLQVPVSYITFLFLWMIVVGSGASSSHLCFWWMIVVVAGASSSHLCFCEGLWWLQVPVLYRYWGVQVIWQILEFQLSAHWLWQFLAWKYCVWVFSGMLRLFVVLCVFSLWFPRQSMTKWCENNEMVLADIFQALIPCFIESVKHIQYFIWAEKNFQTWAFLSACTVLRNEVIAGVQESGTAVVPIVWPSAATCSSALRERCRGSLHVSSPRGPESFPRPQQQQHQQILHPTSHQQQQQQPQQWQQHQQLVQICWFKTPLNPETVKVDKEKNMMVPNCSFSHM